MDLALLGEIFEGSSINYVNKLAPRLLTPGHSMGESNAMESIESRLHQLEGFCKDLELKIKPVVVLVGDRVYKELLSSTNEPFGSNFLSTRSLGRNMELKLS